MFSISNSELEEKPVVTSATVKCGMCGKRHKIKYGTSRKLLEDGTMGNPTVSKTIGFYDCKGKSYLATIEVKLIKGEPIIRWI